MPTLSHHMRASDENVVDIAHLPDRIGETFSEKTVFITGATGSVGRALVEKILHCTEVKRIYILIKNKHGVDSIARFAKYFADDFFGPLLKDRPESPKKVHVIQGDISELDLGISCEDRRTLINEVDIIYHSGASVRFDEFIKKIVLVNVRGTRNMITLAKEVKHLQLFVHVSTTYCQPRGVELAEGPSVFPHDPHEMITIAENMDDASLNILTPKLIGSYGNTYTYSKALAEAIVFEQMEKLPILMVRPSIILPCLEHPIAGYTDSMYGPMSFLILYSKGLLHVTNVPFNTILEYIPLDMFINTLLITTHFNCINDTAKKIYVCNATNITWSMKTWYNNALDILPVCPLKPVLPYPWLIITSSPMLYYLGVYFTQLLPALMVDNIVKLTGIKTDQKLVNIQRKLSRATISTSFYSMCDKWYIKNDVIRTLRLALNEREDKTYSLDVDNIDLFKYAIDVIGHIRRNVLFEKDEDLPKAKQMWTRFKIVHYIMMACLMMLGLWFSYSRILPFLVNLSYQFFDV